MIALDIEILSAMDLEILRVENCRKARCTLQNGLVPGVIVTSVSLGDDNWCGLVRLTVKLGVGAPVILSCSSADERLWSEALWRGVYDLLVEPHEDDQVRWIVGGALRAQPYLPPKPFSRATRAATGRQGVLFGRS